MYRLLDKVYDWVTSDRADEIVGGVLVIWLGAMTAMVGLLAVAAVIG